MHNFNSALTWVIGGWFMSLSRGAHAEWVNLRPSVTPVSREIFQLHSYALWVVTIVAMVVIGAILWSVISHRKSRRVEAAPWHDRLGVEVAWTVIPFVILSLLAAPAIRGVLVEDASSDADLTIKVTGHESMWSYDYQGAFEYSAGKLEEVVIPVDRTVRLLITAEDAARFWWVPDLGEKQKAIPGFINEVLIKAEETGVFHGRCAGSCDREPVFMPIVVRAVSNDEYRAWVMEQKGAAQGGGAWESSSDRAVPAVQ